MEGLADQYSQRELSALSYVGQMVLFDAFGEVTASSTAEVPRVSIPTALKLLEALRQAGLVDRIAGRPAVYRLAALGEESLCP